MLVLTRRPGEEIVIAGKIVIKFLGMKGTAARIGVSAPPEIEVHRKEVFDLRRRKGPRHLARNQPVF